MTTTATDRERLCRQAYLLALVTIGYNVLEGLVSVWFGASDEAFTLFGFGLDSFVEVISGIAVWHLVRRLRDAGSASPDPFERGALRITGGAFYLLAAGLVATAAVNVLEHHRPTTTFWGVVVSIVSIVFMGFLIRAKERVGRLLDSPAILADAACSRTCLYLSVVLLLASGGFAVTGIGSLDAIGTAAIAWFAFREGREAFGKAKGMACSCSGGCHSA